MRLKATTPVHLTDDQILAAAEAVYLKRMKRHGRVRDSEDTHGYLRAHCGLAEREVVGCLFLDSSHRILACEDLFFGTVNTAEVHPRVVLQRGLELNAAAVILYHNHPSGDPSPSMADRTVTAHLKQALDIVDIKLLDHVVVGAEGFASMADRGWV